MSWWTYIFPVALVLAIALTAKIPEEYWLPIILAIVILWGVADFVITFS